MSAETLRRAAGRICHDVEFGQAHGDDDFLLAVADWLEEAAEHLDDFGDFDYVPTEHVCPTAREGLDCSVLGQALTVARAYLGEQP